MTITTTTTSTTIATNFDNHKCPQHSNAEICWWWINDDEDPRLNMLSLLGQWPSGGDQRTLGVLSAPTVWCQCNLVQHCLGTHHHSPSKFPSPPTPPPTSKLLSFTFVYARNTCSSQNSVLLSLWLWLASISLCTHDDNAIWWFWLWCNKVECSGT